MKKVEEIHGKRKFRKKTYKKRKSYKRKSYKRKTYKRKTYKKRKTYRKKRKLINKSYRRRYIGGSRRTTTRVKRARNFLKSSIDSHFNNEEVREMLKDPESFTNKEVQNIVNKLNSHVTKRIESLIIEESLAVQKAVLHLLAVVAPKLTYLHGENSGTPSSPDKDEIEWFCHTSRDLGNILRQIISDGLVKKDKDNVKELLNSLEMEDLKRFAILYTYEPEPVEKLPTTEKKYLSKMIIDEMFSPEPEPEPAIDQSVEIDTSVEVKEEDTDQVIEEALLMMKTGKPHKKISKYLQNKISSEDIFDRVKSKPDDQYTEDELSLLGLLEFLPSPK